MVWVCISAEGWREGGDLKKKPSMSSVPGYNQPWSNCLAYRRNLVTILYLPNTVIIKTVIIYYIIVHDKYLFVVEKEKEQIVKGHLLCARHHSAGKQKPLFPLDTLENWSTERFLCLRQCRISAWVSWIPMPIFHLLMSIHTASTDESNNRHLFILCLFVLFT